MVKSRFYGTEATDVKQAVLARAFSVYDAALRLLHPIMPFVTEELWQAIAERAPLETVMRARILEADSRFTDAAVESEMAFVQQVIESLRTLRSEMGIPPGKEITLLMRTGPGHSHESVRRYQGYLQRLARVRSLEFLTTGPRPRLAASVVVEGEELYVPLEGLIDIDLERARVQKEIDRVAGILEGVRRKLSNENFVEKAPKDVVEKEREKLDTFGQTLEKLEKNLSMLNA
jgi:valyl-tRNA synthetase